MKSDFAAARIAPGLISQIIEFTKSNRVQAGRHYFESARASGESMHAQKCVAEADVQKKISYNVSADFASNAALKTPMAQFSTVIASHGGQKMKIRSFFLAVASCALLSLLTVSAFAQVGRIEGEVVKAGSAEPVVGAVVEIVRTDIKGNYPLKSDKKGKFLHAGVPYVGTYTILVSAEGFAPSYLAGIRPTGEPLKIELNPGDGRKLTLEDLKKSGGGAATAPGGAAPKISEADAKKAKEEYEKAVKEREEAEKYNAAIGQINIQLKAGQDAMAKNDLNAAVTAFGEAVKMNPTIDISQGNLAIALQKRAVGQFNAGNKDAAKQDFTDSIAAVSKALESLDAKEKDTKTKGDPIQIKASRRTYFVVKAESESILGGKFGDPAQTDAAVKDYQTLVELSDEPAKKKEYPLKAANLLRETSRQAEAVAAYKAILETDPENIEALYGLGLAYANEEKTWQDSANMLQKFADKAPENDPRVAEAKSVIGALLQGNKNLVAPKSDAGKGKPAPAKKKP